MAISRRTKWLLGIGALLVLAAATLPWTVPAYWSVRSSNPVRRGVQRAGELGCFSCHGPYGTEGIPDPGTPDHDVPSWDGGVWMMYVENDREIRDFILNGSSPEDHGSAGHDHGTPEIEMPAYENVLSGTDLEDLVAGFKVLSRMSLPPADSTARRGYDVAQKWRCFSCHGPAGSGGLSNPGSFTGFIPGWYGAGFDDLVRDRQEFDDWILEGSIPRLADHPIASFFIRRQRVSMPAYRDFSPNELEDLWAYARWLGETGGGSQGTGRSWDSP